jgi:competence protein ComEC
LRITFLSVDHGNAVLLELPGGGTLLYDGGTFGRGSTAARTIRQALWSRGIQRLDAVVISHADVDHFNGIPLLLEQVPVGSILLAHSFLDERQPAVVELCEAAARRGVPLRLLVKGDRLQYRPAHRALSAASLELEVLHPPPGWNMPDDNANSVVLELNWGNRRVLLTGDVEGPGLPALLGAAPGRCDILLAPHHGARSANPRELYDWAQPELVVISAGDPAVRNRIEQVVRSRETRVLSTAESGAITISLTATGEITVSEHLALVQSVTQGELAFPGTAE